MLTPSERGAYLAELISRIVRRKYPGRMNKTKLENQVSDGSLALNTKTTASPDLMFNSNFLPSKAPPTR